MIYDTIPALVHSTIQALYSGIFITFDTSRLAQASHFIQTNDQVASIKVLLSQISLVVCTALLMLIIFVMTQARAHKANVDAAAVQPAAAGDAPVLSGALRDRWNQLLTNLESTHENQWKMAVIEADTLVDDAMTKAGYPGATFGDRLSNIEPGMLLSLDGVWWAHKIRNRLAHEADYFLRYTEARQAVGYYEAALVELQLI